jgi:hypothetical protein
VPIQPKVTKIGLQTLVITLFVIHLLTQKSSVGEPWKAKNKIKT